MPLTRELSTAVREELGGDEDWSQIPYLDQDFEKAMSYLIDSEPWLSEAERLRNRALFVMISGAIHSGIVKAQKTVLDAMHQCPDWLLRLVCWMHVNKAPVVTLNYDTILEMVASEFYLGMGRMLTSDDLRPFRTSGERISDPQDGHSTFPLLKLHGSLNWTYSGTDSYFGEAIQDALVPRWSAGWLGELGCDPIDGRVPLIVPPTFNKTRYFENEKIRWIWRRSAVALALARRIFCIGYSLPEGDLLMRFLLNDAQPPEDMDPPPGRRIPLYLVNTDPRCRDQFRNLPRWFQISEDFVLGREREPVRSFTDALLGGALDSSAHTVRPLSNLPRLVTCIRQACPEESELTNLATGGKFHVLGVNDCGVLLSDPPGSGTRFALWHAFETCLRVAATGRVYHHFVLGGVDSWVAATRRHEAAEPFVDHPCEQQILSMLCAAGALERVKDGTAVRFKANEYLLHG